jgi:hypothetical protein
MPFGLFIDIHLFGKHAFKDGGLEGIGRSHIYFDSKGFFQVQPEAGYVEQAGAFEIFEIQVHIAVMPWITPCIRAVYRRTHYKIMPFEYGNDFVFDCLDVHDREWVFSVYAGI